YLEIPAYNRCRPQGLRTGPLAGGRQRRVALLRRLLWIGAAAGIGRYIAGKRFVRIRNGRYIAVLDHTTTIVCLVSIAIIGLQVVPVTVGTGVRHYAAATEIGFRRAISCDCRIRAAAGKGKQAVRVGLPAAGHRRAGQSWRWHAENLGKKLGCRRHRHSDRVTVGLSVRTALVVQRSDGDTARAVVEPIFRHYCLGLGLIRARPIPGSRNGRRVRGILQGALYAMPSSYIDSQTKNANENRGHEGKDKGDRATFI